MLVSVATHWPGQEVSACEVAEVVRVVVVVGVTCSLLPYQALCTCLGRYFKVLGVALQVRASCGGGSSAYA